jgi:hypothetical protein
MKGTIPNRRHPALASAALVALLVPVAGWPSPATGQAFTRITDGAIGSDRGNTLGGAWADYDDDGDLGLFLPNAAGIAANLLYRNDGNRSFTRIFDEVLANDPGVAALGTCWADYDNDGDLDAYNAGAPNSFLYRNGGSGTYTKIVDGDIGGASDDRGWSCAWGEYNAHGYVDLFVTHPAGFGWNRRTCRWPLAHSGRPGPGRISGSRRHLSLFPKGSKSTPGSFRCRLSLRAIPRGAACEPPARPAGPMRRRQAWPQPEKG